MKLAWILVLTLTELFAASAHAQSGSYLRTPTQPPDFLYSVEIPGFEGTYDWKPGPEFASFAVAMQEGGVVNEAWLALAGVKSREQSYLYDGRTPRANGSCTIQRVPHLKGPETVHFSHHAAQSSYVFTGKLMGSKEGFLQGDIVTLFLVRINEVIRAPARPDGEELKFAFLFYPQGQVRLADEVFCVGPQRDWRPRSGHEVLVASQQMIGIAGGEGFDFPVFYPSDEQVVFVDPEVPGLVSFSRFEEGNPFYGDARSLNEVISSLSAVLGVKP